MREVTTRPEGAPALHAEDRVAAVAQEIERLAREVEQACQARPMPLTELADLCLGDVPRKMARIQALARQLSPGGEG